MIEIEHGHYCIDGFTLDIDLHVKTGEFCAVLGPSGAGKSTLLSIIAGFENLESGALRLDDCDAAEQPLSRPVSMIFQDHNVFAHLDVWSNVALGILPSLRLNSQEQAQVASALLRVGLENFAKRKPGELSGGERQRIALARVLVRDKPILLLDEPFAALDPALRRDMLDLVCELQVERRLTVLLVTHNPVEVEHVAGKIIFVSEGRVFDAVPTKAFFTSREQPVVHYLGK
jgi:thiamine transport system ATP-binding protein